MKITTARRAHLLKLLTSQLHLEATQVWAFRQHEFTLFVLHGAEPHLYAVYCKLLIAKILQDDVTTFTVNGVLPPVPKLLSGRTNVITGGNSDAMLQCRHCGGEGEIIAIRQLRSADEPMTVFCKCTQCDKRWTM